MKKDTQSTGGANPANLASFALVAQERSFRRAASKLGVTPSTLSHAVSALEARLAIRLLNRTTRHVSPTEAGEHLLARLAPALADIAQAVDSLNDFREQPRGTVRLNASRDAIDLVVVPKLRQLADSFPDIVLELTANEGFVDIVQGGFDAGIRLGESLEGGMKTVRASDALRLSVVASPSYFERHARPRLPQDLLAHRCIGWRRVASGALHAWQFKKGKKAVDVAVGGHLILDDARLMVTAALEGVGVTFALEDQVAGHVAAGLLERVLADWCPSFPGFYLYYPNRRHHSAALSAVIELLRKTGP